MSSVDHDLLADYLGGALDGTPTYAYVDHLVTTSPEWRRAAAEMTSALEAVTRDLAALREEQPVMPAVVAERFDELFAGPKRDPLAAQVVDRQAARRKRRKWQRWAAPVAVAAAAVTFFALGKIPALTTIGAGTTADDSGYAREGVAPQAEQPAAAPQPVPTIRSSQQYDRANLSRRQAALSFSSEDRSYKASSPEAARSTARLDAAEALQACLDAVALAAPGKPTLVEYAFFEGSPALVISVTTISGDVSFVAGPGCGVGGADELYRAPLK